MWTCTSCKYLKVVNKEPVYAKCTLTDYTFLLWDEDTDNHVCSHYDDNVTVEDLIKMSSYKQK